MMLYNVVLPDLIMSLIELSWDWMMLHNIELCGLNMSFN